MADPLSITSGVVALVTFALSASVNLYATIRDFKSRDKKARVLKDELGDLSSVLQTLLETITNHAGIDFDALKGPLHRCGNACREYAELIARCTKHSTDSHASTRDWIHQKYLQGDIADFRDMLAGYKSTINIALASVNIQVAAITPQVLEDYKDLISDANQDLGERLQKLENAIQDLSRQGVQGSIETSLEWQAMLDEKKYTQQGLRMAAQLSAQIETLEVVPDEPAHLSDKPSAHKFIKSGLDATKGSISTLVSQLRNHENKINEQMEAMVSEASAAPLSSDTLTELRRLRETKDSIHQCINIVSSAGNGTVIERQNIFEDITLADNAYNYAVSTVGDLVTARRINLSGRSRNIGGQISDESFQMSIQNLTNLDIKHAQLQDSEPEVPAPQPSKRDDTGSVFDYRFGRGVKLSASPTKQAE